MRSLIEKLSGDVGIVSEGKDFGAMNLLKKSVMPDGSRAPGGVKMFFAVNNDVKVKPLKEFDGENYKAVFVFQPGSGGGSGLSIKPTISNDYFNQVGTGQAQIRDMQIALGKHAKKNSRKLNDDIMKWFKNRKNLVWRAVGWKNKGDYLLHDVDFENVKYGDAWIDPSRRKWPAGRTEAWVPVIVTVNAKMKRAK